MCDKIKISVQFDTIHKTLVNKERILTNKWALSYGWMPEYYTDLKNELNKVTKEGEPIGLVQDPRSSLLRSPKTSSGMIGWIASIKEFHLETYGPDILFADPLLHETAFW